MQSGDDVTGEVLEDRAILLGIIATNISNLLDVDAVFLGEKSNEPLDCV